MCYFATADITASVDSTDTTDYTTTATTTAAAATTATVDTVTTNTATAHAHVIAHDKAPTTDPTDWPYYW